MRVGSAAQVHVYGFTCVSKGLRTGQRVNVRSIGCTLRILGSRASTCTAPDAESAKVQTHSPQTACFQRFSPDGSPVSQPHRLKLRPRRHRSGGIAPHGGPTRRRHADAAFRMAQTPTTTGVERTRGPGRPAPSARGLWQGSARLRADTPSHPARPSHRISGTKLSPLTRPRRISGTKLSPLTRNGPIWRNPRMQGEFCTVFTTMKPSRENFVPNTRQKSS